MNKKELKINENSQNKNVNCQVEINKNSTKAYSHLISNLQPLISDHRGITLIALVITIIVMLILVGVTVSVAINGGLFNTAKDAARKTQYEADRESLLSAVVGAIDKYGNVDSNILEGNLPEGFTKSEDGGYTSKSGNTFYVDEYGNITDEKVNSEPGDEPTGEGWTLGENGDTVTNGEVTVNIGDYVDYTPDHETYPVKDLGADYTGSTSNTSALETQDKLNWRILGLDKNGCLTIISDKPTDTKVYFSGAKGYNNGVYMLNDICAKLYSSTQYGEKITVRSLTIEDVEAGFSDNAKAQRDSYANAVTYGEPKTYSETNVKYPALFAEENGSGIGVTDENKENGRLKNEIGVSHQYYKTKEELTGKKQESYTAGTDDNQPNNALTCTQTYYGWKSTPAEYCRDRNGNFYNMIFKTSTYYWLASRYVDCSSSYAYFGLRFVNYTNLDSNYMFSSDGNAYSNSNYIRPVVSLGPNIKVNVKDGTGVQGDPYKLIEE